MVARALTAQGWVLVGRNVRIPGSELDLVARRGGTLAIVEVKARRHRPVGERGWSGLLSAGKRRALQRGAAAFLSRPEALAVETVRFDLAVVYRAGGRSRIEYLVGVL